MKKTIFINIIVLLTLIGCEKKTQNIEKPKIEIYLPKERIVSKDGVKIKDEWSYRGVPKNDSSWILLNEFHRKYARLDTITHNTIYAGNFSASETDLPKNPFIYDNEIIEFNFETSEIKISASGVEKLWSLQPNFNYSRQFIVTVDRKPILTGYFYSVLSSSYVKHFYIVYSSGHEGLEKPEFNDESFRIEYNSESEYIWELEKFDFKSDKEFYESFKESGKIAQPPASARL